MTLRKTGNKIQAMLRNALNQIRRHTNIQDTISLVGKHINTGLSRSHAAIFIKIKAAGSPPATLKSVILANAGSQ
ncbi:hypothetical protein [Dyella sp.]|uniref:hypothetical protein n=1 Tax=Dyella sp. TaxID=1869338 RepID=UPI002FDAAB24